MSLILFSFLVNDILNLGLYQIRKVVLIFLIENCVPYCHTQQHRNFPFPLTVCEEIVCNYFLSKSYGSDSYLHYTTIDPKELEWTLCRISFQEDYVLWLWNHTVEYWVIIKLEKNFLIQLVVFNFNFNRVSENKNYILNIQIHIWITSV